MTGEQRSLLRPHRGAKSAEREAAIRARLLRPHRRAWREDALRRDREDDERNDAREAKRKETLKRQEEEGDRPRQ